MATGWATIYGPSTEPESLAYNMPGGTRLTGPLDIPALAAATQ